MSVRTGRFLRCSLERASHHSLHGDVSGSTQLQTLSLANRALETGRSLMCANGCFGEDRRAVEMAWIGDEAVVPVSPPGWPLLARADIPGSLACDRRSTEAGPGADRRLPAAKSQKRTSPERPINLGHAPLRHVYELCCCKRRPVTAAHFYAISRSAASILASSDAMTQATMFGQKLGCGALLPSIQRWTDEKL